MFSSGILCPLYNSILYVFYTSFIAAYTLFHVSMKCTGVVFTTSSSKLVERSFSLWIILVVKNIPHTYNHGVSLETVLLPLTVGIRFLHVPYVCHYSLQSSSHMINNLVVLWLVKHYILFCNFKNWPLGNFNEKLIPLIFFYFKIKKSSRRNTYFTCARE